MNEGQEIESRRLEGERGTQRCTDCGNKHRRRSDLLRPCSKCGGEVTLDTMPPGPESKLAREERRRDERDRPRQRCTDCGHMHRRTVRVGRPCEICEGEVESLYAQRLEPWTPERVDEVLRANREAAISGGSEMR